MQLTRRSFVTTVSVGRQLTVHEGIQLSAGQGQVGLHEDR
jgi:hypothetical protein